MASSSKAHGLEVPLGSKLIHSGKEITLGSRTFEVLVYQVKTNRSVDNPFLSEWHDVLQRLEEGSQPLSNKSIINADTTGYTVLTDLCARPLLYPPDSTFAILVVATNGEEKGDVGYLWLTSLKAVWLNGQQAIFSFSYLERTNAKLRRIGLSKRAVEIINSELPFAVLDALATRFAGIGDWPGGVTAGGYVALDNSMSMSRVGDDPNALFMFSGSHTLLLLRPLTASATDMQGTVSPPAESSSVGLDAWARCYLEAYGTTDFMLMPNELSLLLQHTNLTTIASNVSSDTKYRIACMVWSTQDFADLVLTSDQRRYPFVLLSNFIVQINDGPWSAISPLATFDAGQRDVFVRLIDSVSSDARFGAKHMILDFDTSSCPGWIGTCLEQYASRLIGREEEIYNTVKDQKMDLAVGGRRGKEEAERYPRFLDPRDHSTLLYFSDKSKRARL